MDDLDEVISFSKISQSKMWIPKEIRTRLKIDDGDKVLWGIKKGEIIVRKYKKKDDIIAY